MTAQLPLTYLYRITPLVLGHRGASAYAPENTLEAFRLALEQGADGFELDVTLSADGIPVVIHDDRVDRTTNGHGAVIGLTLRELKGLDAGQVERFGGQFAGARIPTLAEAFEACAPTSLVNVELKVDRSPGRLLAKQVVEVIHAHERSKRVLVSSFRFGNLARVKALDPELPVALLYKLPRFGPRLAKCLAGRLPHEAHNPASLGLSAGDIVWYHRQGLRVNAWTVDDESEMRRLIVDGVDGLITNRPDVAVRVRADSAGVSGGVRAFNS